MTEKQNKGTITQIIGVVADVHFPEALPNIFNALEVKMPSGETLTLEVQQHIGGNAVRAVAMSATDGLERGAEVVDTGAPIMVPVGPETLGRMFNVTGDVIDNLGPAKEKRNIPFTGQPRNLKNNPPNTKFWKPASKLLTLSVRF